MMARILFNPDLQEVFEEAKKRNVLRNFVDSVTVKGEENLDKLYGRQFVDFSNHESHGDYFALGYELMNRGFGCPMITAGKNLDVWPINQILPFDKWGKVVWIDRRLIKYGSKEKRVEHAHYLENRVKESLALGNNFADFVWGGRNYNNEMKEVKTGIIKHVLKAVKELDGKEVYGIVSVFHYDRRIEELAMPLIRFTNDNGKMLRPLYYLADILSFVKEPFLRHHPNLTINFGEPFLLNEYSKNSRGLGSLKKLIEEQITELYNFD